MSSNSQRVLTNEEIACVSGANGTTNVAPGPNGEGCIPPLGWPFNQPPVVIWPIPAEMIAG